MTLNETLKRNDNLLKYQYKLFQTGFFKRCFFSSYVVSITKYSFQLKSVWVSKLLGRTSLYIKLFIYKGVGCVVDGGDKTLNFLLQLNRKPTQYSQLCAHPKCACVPVVRMVLGIKGEGYTAISNIRSVQVPRLDKVPCAPALIRIIRGAQCESNNQFCSLLKNVSNPKKIGHRISVCHRRRMQRNHLFYQRSVVSAYFDRQTAF